jgi:hypothetical protein
MGANMRISHKNSIQGYVGDWLMAMGVKARAEGKSSSGLKVPQPVHSLMRHELNLCLMLELFGDCLTRFEKSLNGEKTDCDYGAYSEAIAFLDAIYVFSRMLLDSAMGIVKHRDFDKSEKGREFPKSFDDMYKKSLRGELPNNLNAVFLGCTWFPQLKDRRDAIVHDYETYFIVFGQNSEGEKTAQQFSPLKNAHAIVDEDLRSYIGMVMAGYQRFVDGLLDYWDEMFLSWYHMSIFRHSTTFMGRRANILWWAHKYGGYTNDNMVVSES